MSSNRSNDSNTQVSQYMRDKANRTRLAIESYYAQAITQFNEREERVNKLVKQLVELSEFNKLIFKMHALVLRFK